MLKNRMGREKETVSLGDLSADWLRAKLEAAQQMLHDRALAFREANTRRASSYDELKEILSKEGGFARAYVEPGDETEEKIQSEAKASVRCIPFDQPDSPG